MKIGISFDLVPDHAPGTGPDDRYEEFDKPQTVEAIARVIQSRGHDVSYLGDGRAFLERVLAEPPDLVFNIAEGEGVGRCREARVPAALELLGIPCTGSDPLTLAVALDKHATKRMVADCATVPSGLLLEPGLDRQEVRNRLDHALQSGALDGGLWILKPAFEGSSKGIRGQCLTGDPDELVEGYERVSQAYTQAVLIEAFIAGDEVTVGVVGNGADRRVIGAMQIVPTRRDEPFVYSLEVKRDWQERVRYETPANLDDAVRQRLFADALAICQALDCRDVARIDFRIRDGVPFFIEINPLPGLAPGYSDLVLLAEGHGMSHDALIAAILDAAIQRVSRSRDVPALP